MAQGFRPDRLGDQIRAETSEIVARELHDPKVGLITITRVQVTSDLQIARIYYTTMADEAARKETAKALQRATPFIRHQLAGRMTLRRMPEIEFRFDRSVEHHDRIEKLLHQIHEEEASRPAGEPDAGPPAGDDEPPHEQ
jgi:ribosome-binding factor A